MADKKESDSKEEEVVWPEDQEDYDEFSISSDEPEVKEPTITEELPTEGEGEEESEGEDSESYEEKAESEEEVSEEEVEEESEEESDEEEEGEGEGDDEDGEEEGSPVELPDDAVLQFPSDGEEVETTYAELKKSHGLAKKANRVIQEASEMKEQAKAALEGLMEPEKALDVLADLYAQSLGGDKEKARRIVDREVVVKRVDVIMKREQMTEEQRKIYDLEQEKARRDAELEELRSKTEESEKRRDLQAKATAALPLVHQSIESLGLKSGGKVQEDAENVLARLLYQGENLDEILVDSTVRATAERIKRESPDIWALDQVKKSSKKTASNDREETETVTRKSKPATRKRKAKPKGSKTASTSSPKRRPPSDQDSSPWKADYFNDW